MKHCCEVDAGRALSENLIGVGVRLPLEHGQENLLLGPHSVLLARLRTCAGSSRHNVGTFEDVRLIIKTQMQFEDVRMIG